MEPSDLELLEDSGALGPGVLGPGALEPGALDSAADLASMEATELDRVTNSKCDEK